MKKTIAFGLMFLFGAVFAENIPTDRQIEAVRQVLNKKPDANVPTFRQLRLNEFKNRKPESIKSFEILYEIQTDKGEKGSILCRQKYPDKSRLDLRCNGEDYSVGFDGKNYWESFNGKTGPLSPKRIAGYRYDFAFAALPYGDDGNIFADLEIVGDETIDGIPCTVYYTYLREDSSRSITLAVEKQSGLIRRIVSSGREGKVVVSTREREELGGVALAKSFYIAGSNIAATYQLKRAKSNIELDDAIFDRPADKPADGNAAVKPEAPAPENPVAAPSSDPDVKELIEQITAEGKKLSDLGQQIVANHPHPEKETEHPGPWYFRQYDDRESFVYRATHQNERESDALMEEYNATRERLLHLRIKLIQKQLKSETPSPAAK